LFEFEGSRFDWLTKIEESVKLAKGTKTTAIVTERMGSKRIMISDLSERHYDNSLSKTDPGSASLRRQIRPKLTGMIWIMIRGICELAQQSRPGYVKIDQTTN
jgi:hypothetical protein